MKNPSFVNLQPRRRRGWSSAQERERWIEAWQGSGLTQAEFAATNGLSVSTLRNWVRNRRSKPDMLPAFREISVGDLLKSSGGVPPAPWEAEIRLPDGMVMALAPGVGIDRVKELLKALRC